MPSHALAPTFIYVIFLYLYPDNDGMDTINSDTAMTGSDSATQNSIEVSSITGSVTDSIPAIHTLGSQAPAIPMSITALQSHLFEAPDQRYEAALVGGVFLSGSFY